jgi:hypothetical protein
MNSSKTRQTPRPTAALEGSPLPKPPFVLMDGWTAYDVLVHIVFTPEKTH